MFDEIGTARQAAVRLASSMRAVDRLLVLDVKEPRGSRGPWALGLRPSAYDLVVSRWIAPGIAVLACVWLVLIVAAPSLWVPAAGVLYAAGSFICHQIPERSFHVDGSQLPVCARCFGLYGGGAFGSVAAAISACRRRVTAGAPDLTRQARWTLTAIAAIPTAATVALEWGFGWPLSNAIRATAALALGFAVAFVVVTAAATVHYE